jgi:hypothetical protein
MIVTAERFDRVACCDASPHAKGQDMGAGIVQPDNLRQHRPTTPVNAAPLPDAKRPAQPFHGQRQPGNGPHLPGDSDPRRVAHRLGQVGESRFHE